jgi:glutamate-5-semialdehyde dehydrogenase
LYEKSGVEIRGCSETSKILKNHIRKAAMEDWGKEYLDLIIAVKIVKSLDEAIDYVNKYGSNHTDAIITEDGSATTRFMNEVDSSSVIWNASTRFSDGYRYGLGAEVGISTNKIHARGPTGLEGLTIYKYHLLGSGQIVKDYVGEVSRQFSHRILSKRWKDAQRELLKE